MTEKFFRKIFLLVIAFILGADMLFSQSLTDPASEYARIREIAFSGDHLQAEKEARKLVNAYPEYGDARILLARVVAWQKNYDKATMILDTLLLKEPDNRDALELKNDIENWSGQESAAKAESSTNIIGGYSFDTFREPYPRFWQVFKAGISNKFLWGTGALYANIGNININGEYPDRKTEFQLEAEAWPVLSARHYAYLCYAYSPGIYFPGHRAAGEIWQVMPHGWSISAGLNYYYFDRSIFISGISVEKYLKGYWLSAKGFVYFKDDGPTTSAYFNARRYFNDDNYFQLTVGAGTAPDEPFDIRTDISRLSATTFRIAYNKKTKSKITYRISAGYSYEEYAEAAWRNRYDGSIVITIPVKRR